MILSEIPRRPDGLELVGTMEGSGYRTPPSLVRRQDGQTLQLTELLYAILEAADGRRAYSDIADRVSARTGRSVAASDVATLVDRELRPLGLLLQADGTAPVLKRSRPLTGLNLKLAVTDPAWTRRLTEPFTALFHWWVWVPVVIGFGVLAWWLLMDRGLAAATYQAFAKPELLVVVLAITLLSAGFHEFGHAAAARRGGARPGVMGAGMYLLWPAFYTDVTDSYRLGRAGRIRTDLGGLYFNAIVALAIAAVWWATRWDALLLIVAAQILQMLRQLVPLVRFDGYHVLADLTGVPDLFSRIGPILTSFWPTRWGDPRVTQLKWWTRVLVTGWVLVVVPVLLFCLLALVLAVPRVVGTAWAGIGREAGQMALHWSAGRGLDAVGAGLAMVAISLPILAAGMILWRVAASSVTSLWRRTDGRPVRRAGAGALVFAAALALAFAWWPSPERYRPIGPHEDGTLRAVAATFAQTEPPVSVTPPRTGGETTAVLPPGPMPTEKEPRLALVLVPREAPPDGATDPSDGAAPTWIFPFDEPLPPEPGDNQAFAVNTTDRSVAYDIAIAMIWVTGEDPVLNVNEAYAFASCADCVTVAVAFQVVLIVGNADIVVPQNLAGAVNYECFQCITAAVASQLVVTVDALPGADQQVALADVWADVAAFAESIPTLPLADVITRLEEYKAAILVILGEAALPQPSPSPGVAGTPAPSAGPTATAMPSAGTSPSITPGTTDSPSTTPPTMTPSATPSQPSPDEPTPSATPDATSSPAVSTEPSSTPAPSPPPDATSSPAP